MIAASLRLHVWIRSMPFWHIRAIITLLYHSRSLAVSWSTLQLCIITYIQCMNTVYKCNLICCFSQGPCVPLLWRKRKFRSIDGVRWVVQKPSTPLLFQLYFTSPRLHRWLIEVQPESTRTIANKQAYTKRHDDSDERRLGSRICLSTQQWRSGQCKHLLQQVSNVNTNLYTFFSL